MPMHGNGNAAGTACCAQEDAFHRTYPQSVASDSNGSFPERYFAILDAQRACCICMARIVSEMAPFLCHDVMTLFGCNTSAKYKQLDVIMIHVYYYSSSKTATTYIRVHYVVAYILRPTCGNPRPLCASYIYI